MQEPVSRKTRLHETLRSISNLIHAILNTISETHVSSNIEIAEVKRLIYPGPLYKVGLYGAS